MSCPSAVRVIIALAALVLAHALYAASLQGSPTLEGLKPLLVRIGILLITSTISFTVCVFLMLTLSALGRFPVWFRMLFCVAVVSSTTVSFVFQFSLDQGDNFLNHGNYNTLVWCALTVLQNAILYFVYGLYRALSRRTFWRVILALCLALLLVVPLRLVRGYYLWPLGINARLESHVSGLSLCQWKLSGYAWLDVLPSGALNFWAGSSTCPPEMSLQRAQSWEVVFADRTLEVKGCSAKITYQLFPDTRNFTASEKTFAVFPNTVFNRMSMLAYNAPVRIEGTVDAVIVHCEGNGRKIAIDIQPSMSAYERGERLAPPQRNASSPNVLLLFTDAVSRRHFLRRLPNTVAQLARYTQRAAPTKLFEFFRYHAIAFATDPTTRALYTGHEQLYPRIARPTIWEYYNRAGYATMRTESNCEDWSRQYTAGLSSDYLTHEFLAHACHPDVYDLNGHPHGVWKGPYSILRRCLAGRYVHDYSMEYTKRFIDLYGTQLNQPWFAAVALQEGHEGTGEVLSTLDDSLVDLLQFLERGGMLANTAVIFCSDHGLHMGPGFIFTQYGRVEHTNPHLMLLLPPLVLRSNESTGNDVSSEWEQALVHNQQALLNAHDIHHTMRALVHFGAKRSGQSSAEEGQSWGASLFVPKPLDRSCGDARVPGHLCKCE